MSGPPPTSPSHVHYAELRGERAEEVLWAFLRALEGHPDLRGAELLTSAAQPGLALVASRWAGAAPPNLPVPTGAKTWSFQVRAHLEAAAAAAETG